MIMLRNIWRNIREASRCDLYYHACEALCSFNMILSHYGHHFLNRDWPISNRLLVVHPNFVVDILILCFATNLFDAHLEVSSLCRNLCTLQMHCRMHWQHQPYQNLYQHTAWLVSTLPPHLPPHPHQGNGWMPWAPWSHHSHYSLPLTCMCSRQGRKTWIWETHTINNYPWWRLEEPTWRTL